MIRRGTMAKYEIKREFARNSANECYQACLQAVRLANYTIVKKRDIASLLICETLLEGMRVSANLVVPMSKPTSVILSFSGDSADELTLKQEADRVLDILASQLQRRKDR